MDRTEAQRRYRAAISGRHVQGRRLTNKEISLVRWARKVVDILIIVIGSMSNAPDQRDVMQFIMDAYHLIQPDLPPNWTHIEIPEEDEM